MSTMRRERRLACPNWTLRSCTASVGGQRGAPYGDAAGRALLQGVRPPVGGQQPASRLDADDRKQCGRPGCAGSPQHSLRASGHHPCPVSIRALTAEQTLKGAGSASTMIEGLSAITLATHDMCRAVRFYQALGFELLFGGGEAAFTSFRVGTSYLNLIAQPAERQWSWWGRVIFYVGDVASIGPSGLLRCHREPQFTDQRPTSPRQRGPGASGRKRA